MNVLLNFFFFLFHATNFINGTPNQLIYQCSEKSIISFNLWLKRIFQPQINEIIGLQL